MAEIRINRRRLLVGSAAVGAAGAAEAAALHDGMLGGPPQTFHGTMPWRGGAADAPPGVEGTDYIYFNALEAAFIEAACERLIPSDSVGPGAMEAGLPVFIDTQQAGANGQGQQLFLGGAGISKPPEPGAALSNRHPRH